MQEEVEVKTKKLKKLFAKYQGAVRETQDLQEVGGLVIVFVLV